MAPIFERANQINRPNIVDWPFSIIIFFLDWYIICILFLIGVNADRLRENNNNQIQLSCKSQPNNNQHPKKNPFSLKQTDAHTHDRGEVTSFYLVVVYVYPSISYNIAVVCALLLLLWFCLSAKLFSDQLRSIAAAVLLLWLWLLLLLLLRVCVCIIPAPKILGLATKARHHSRFFFLF